jgi:long-subunit acyl-CoA synthetase (AMP-forming)
MTSGEVVVRGPTVMQGYWQQPEATIAALRDGWMHSGDVGVANRMSP